MRAYVPETLMAALQELELAYAAAKKDRKFQQEWTVVAGLCRQAYRVDICEEADGGVGRGEDLFEERRSFAYGSAQD